MRTIIFTDLDGTLLNHDDYRFDDAIPALNRIKRLGIPLIIVSSKTAAEIARLQDKLDLHDPFISENGAAIYLPPDSRLADALPTEAHPSGFRTLRLGARYEDIRRFCRENRDLGIRGFGDMETEEVAALTGLGPEDAAMAKAREFTEPFILENETHLERLSRLALESGFSLTRGGRFYHLKKAHSDKGVAVRTLIGLYAGSADGPLRSIALGDSENDREMLREVDIPLVVRKPDGSCLEGFVHCSDAPGSAGWNQLITEVLHDDA